jgi:ABC-type nitrate/sulfonate/bicarbonate transport system substrate-binding protein
MEEKRMPTRIGRSALTATALGAVLAASLVSGGKTAFGSTTAHHPVAAHAKAPVKVHFILNWLPNVEFAGLWAAQQFGWFKKAGIQMTFTPWSASVHPETDVPSQGGNTFGFQSGAAIAIAASQGAPDVAVYSDTQKSVFGLTVLNKSHITKISDLKGKRIGYQPHEIYVPETMLSSAGLKPSDYKLVPVGFDIAQLTSGQVDAYLTFITNEPIALNMQHVGNHTFPAANYGFHFYDDVMFTTSNLIKSNPALVRKVTKVVALGFTWAHENPVAAAKLTTKNFFPASSAGKGVSAANNLRQQTLELQTFKKFSANAKGHYVGLMTQAYWQDSINTLMKYHEIKSAPSASSIFTNKFNPYNGKNY